MAELSSLVKVGCVVGLCVVCMRVCVCLSLCVCVFRGGGMVIDVRRVLDEQMCFLSEFA